MASAISERVELAKLCSSRNWSKAIRVLDSLLSRSFTIRDLCNRAFCYSQLELHKHVIKDCDRALELDPSLLQAYILKGHAYSTLGRREDALAVWNQGYEHALHESADIKQLLELEELLTNARQNGNITNEDLSAESAGSSALLTVSEGHSGSESESLKDQNKSRDESEMSSESDHASEIHSPFIRESPMQNGSIEKGKGNKKFDQKLNGTYDSSSLSNGSESLTTLSHVSEPQCKVDTVETLSKLDHKSSDEFEWSDAIKKNKKFCVARISKTKSISLDFRLSRGIAEVNDGRYAYAVSIFDQILKEDPDYPEALIGRGTAYAFQRELDAAIADFTKAIEVNPSAGEAWKRRGQARAALGDSARAIEDLSKALEFEPNSADILHERGIVNFKFKDFDAAVQDLSVCVRLDRGNKSAYTYLGLALSSIGEYKKAEDSHMKALQLDRDFLEAWTHLTQLYQDLANTNRAFDCLNQVLQIDGRFAKGYYLRGLINHGMGDHRNAIKDLSVALSIESSNVECLYLRASCYHAVGQFREAVKDYDAALDLELDSMEKFVLQCLAFYQKEIALYTASKINNEFCWFDIDGDIDPLFKEYWCKRLHPKDVCEKVYRQPPLRESLRKGKLRKQDFAMTKQKTALLSAADSIGRKIQYNSPGFLPNRRQHRMAGLAAIEIAQRVSRAWRSLQVEWKHSNKGTAAKHGRRIRRKETVTSQNRGGPGCSTSGPSETPTSFGNSEDRSSSRSMMSWQDVYSVAVKWRQISEPCDPVVWINKLSEEFISGFGSHTPLILGQARVVRYFPNFQRTLGVLKSAIKERKCVHSKTDDIIDLSNGCKLQDIMHAESCSDLYGVVGEDFWLATWCNSAAFEGKQLEGTRITLLKTGERGYDFAIRTPCTPSRWEEFDTEMTMAWEALCNAYCGETYGSIDFDALETVRDAILRMTYYWYNFMPLSRGSAVVGFVVLLGLFLAANMEFTGSIPQDLQVDWEAILNFDADSFVGSVKKWLYPSLKITSSWKDYPDVASTFTTTGSVIAALSLFNN
ncbi:Suppressor of RPS4-RLD 1 [Ancistrocladus abbreviatus]